MKAAVLEGKERMVTKEIPIPGINDETMLIRVEACGVCGSDLRIYHQGDARVKYPVILGHEIAGAIEKLGKNVKTFKVGDRVCVAPGHGCGECIYCKKGQENVCINPHSSVGYAYDGGYAQYFVPPVNVIKNNFINKIPDEVSFEEASITEPLACCINGQRNTKIEEGDSVLIFGAGPIGCMHLELSKIKKASKIFVVEPNIKRLRIVKKFMPDRLINPLEEDIIKIIMQETNNLGVNVIFVCAPSKDAQMEGLKLLAPKGKINFFGGLPKDDSCIMINANHVHYKELIITGTSSSLANDNREALNMILTKKINIHEYTANTFPLDMIEEAFKATKEGLYIKTIIKPWE